MDDLYFDPRIDEAKKVLADLFYDSGVNDVTNRSDHVIDLLIRAIRSEFSHYSRRETNDW